MALKHLLLGQLALTPCNGYSLHKNLLEPTRPRLSQIYRALNRMVAEGLVEVKKAKLKKAASQNIYTVTQAGYVELEVWIKIRWGLPPLKESFLLKLWFGKLFDKEDVIASIEAYRDKRKEERIYYEGRGRCFIEAGLEKYGDNSDKFYQDLVFDYMQHRFKYDLDWMEEAICKISNLNPDILKVAGNKRGRKGNKRRQPRKDGNNHLE
ncbi:PadR family transcriptional regulator [Chloroflexota bacterium]